MRLLFILILFQYIYSLPIAVFHGINDNCGGWMQNWTNYIGKKTNSYAKCIESGENLHSVLTGIKSQGETACNIINSTFHEDFIIVGFSQGGLIARYILEMCNLKGKVVKLITVGTPHMGVEKMNCDNYKFLCSSVNFIIPYIANFLPLYYFIAPAGYIRSPKLENFYKKHNKFIAVLNNESIRNDYNKESNKQKILQLKKLVLIKFKNDDMIYPRESAWFEKYDENYKVEELINSEFYTKDYLGLKMLNENNRLRMYEFRGKHMQLFKDEIDKYVINEILN